MARVAFEHVTKHFGDVVAVADLDLCVEDQEFLVLLGPSGCGKSTALRMIAGLEQPSEGVIRIGDRIVNEVEAKNRDVAMVFQSYALYPHMSARQNIEFPLRTRNVSREVRVSRVEEAARALGLADLLERRPGQMSGGQRQRVALARAIVRDPEAFLMDEPLSNLDAKLRVQTRAELVDLQRRLAATVVYVTHDQVEAMTMGHRIAVLNEGRLQQVGPPQAVYEQPANLFVAGFIGSPPMNTFRGTIGRDGDDVVVVVAGGVLPILPGLDANGREVMVGVRPEHLTIGDSGSLQATTFVTESLGHERHVICQLADGQRVIVRQSGDQPAPGDGKPVHLSCRPEHVHLFDAVTGTRQETG